MPKHADQTLGKRRGEERSPILRHGRRATEHLTRHFCAERLAVTRGNFLALLHQPRRLARYAPYDAREN